MYHGYHSFKQEAEFGYFIYNSENGPVKVTSVSSNKYTTFPNKEIGFTDTVYVGVVEKFISKHK